MSNKHQHIVFLRTGWMSKYRGLSGTDNISGGGAFVNKQGYGHEIFNFLPFNGYCYGYFRPPKSGKGSIKLKRLTRDNSDQVENVLVVWVASPKEGSSYIVGWYKNSTLYGSHQNAPDRSNRTFRGEDFGFYAKTRAEDATILPLDDRTFTVPRGKRGFGQANIWYADTPEVEQFKNRVAKYVASWESSKLSKAKKPKKTNIDIERKKKIETSAIEVTTQHYLALGYQLEIVESLNLGWDLEASHPNRKYHLKIEVKGTSLIETNIGLTPNEYAAMKREKDDYRLCIVSNALKNPCLSVYSFSPDSSRWESDEGSILEITEKIAANVKIRE